MTYIVNTNKVMAVSTLLCLNLVAACSVSTEVLRTKHNTGGDNSSLGLSSTYPTCTNGSNTGGGYGWDPKVTDPKGSHSCVVPAAGTTAAAGTSSTYPACTNGSNTGGGYGWDTSVTDPKGSHSCLVPSGGTTASSSGASGSASGTIPALSVSAAGNAQYGIHDYGASLQGNKAGLASACDSAGANAQEKAVIIAIAMQETTYMSPSERDGKKDNTSSANVSILNMNIDMLQHLGYTGSDYGASLNPTNRLPDAVAYMLKGFRSWGIERTLNYHRGGWTAFNDGVSYDAYGYRNAVLTIYNQIKGAPAMETDGRRVEINTVYE